MKQDLKSKVRGWFFRALFYLIGQFLISLAVILAVNADLGVSPGQCLPFVISNAFNISFSTCVTAFFLLLVLLQFLILRKDFKLKNVLQVLGSTVFGLLVDLSTRLIGSWRFESYPGRLFQLLLSVVIMAIGSAIYIDTDIVPMPAEGILLALKKVFPKRSLGTVKNIVDCTWLVLGAALSLLLLHKVIGIREGTVLAALLVGRIIAVIHKPITKYTLPLFYGESGNAGNKS